MDRTRPASATSPAPHGPTNTLARRHHHCAVPIAATDQPKPPGPGVDSIRLHWAASQLCTQDEAAAVRTSTAEVHYNGALLKRSLESPGAHKPKRAQTATAEPVAVAARPDAREPKHKRGETATTKPVAPRNRHTSNESATDTEPTAHRGIAATTTPAAGTPFRQATETSFARWQIAPRRIAPATPVPAQTNDRHGATTRLTPYRSLVELSERRHLQHL